MHGLLEATSKMRFKRIHVKLTFRGENDQLQDG